MNVINIELSVLYHRSVTVAHPFSLLASPSGSATLAAYGWAGHWALWMELHFPHPLLSTSGKGHQCQVESLQFQLLIGLTLNSLKPMKYLFLHRDIMFGRKWFHFMPKMVTKQMKAKLLCLLDSDRFWQQISRPSQAQGLAAWMNYFSVLTVESSHNYRALSRVTTGSCAWRKRERTQSLVLFLKKPQDLSSYSKAHLERIHLSWTLLAQQQNKQKHHKTLNHSDLFNCWGWKFSHLSIINETNCIIR